MFVDLSASTLTMSWSAARGEVPWVVLAWLQMLSEGHV